jgi:AcrR family transcriptional regulator
MVVGDVARRKFQELSALRRTRILTVAAAEFARNGFHGTSYNRLLAKAGVGKGSAYHYFEDKADLFITLVADRQGAFLARFAQLGEPTDGREFWPFVTDLNLQGMRFMIEDPTSAALMRCLVREGPSVALLVQSEKVLNTVEQYYRRILLLGQRLGAVRTDLSVELLAGLSRVMSATLDQWFVNELRVRPAEIGARRLRQVADQWTDISRRLFEPRPRSGPKRNERKNGTNTQRRPRTDRDQRPEAPGL